MTNKEREQIKAWNVNQGEINNNAEMQYRALRKKYSDLIGRLSFSYSGVMLAIATCDKTTKDEKLNDLSTLSRIIHASGRFDALCDFIFTVR